MHMNIGLKESDRKVISGELAKVLADTYTLYLMTQNFHWNATGPLFHTLHGMLELQYQDLANSVDLIAERIRALGHKAPATFSEFTMLSSIKEPGSLTNARDMIVKLLESHETLVRTAREAFFDVETVHDAASVDLLTQRIQWHEKTAWMLRSLVEG